MDVPPSAGLFLNRICGGGIVVEFLEDHPYTLMTRELTLPSSNLKYEFTTLTSDHLPVASGLFRWFRSVITHCNPQNGRGLIYEMVAVFRHYQNNLSIPIREYVLSEGLVDVCYTVQIDDSQLMKQVLDLLYENWASFGSLHFSAILKPSYLRATGGRVSTDSNQSDFLAFYLEHARRLKLEYNGIRLVDVSVYSSIRKAPVYVAADIWCWKPLLRYLQFGARFEDVMVDPSAVQDGEQSALTHTLRSLIRQLWVRLVQPANSLSLEDPKEIRDYCSNLSREVRDLCRTLKIIFRVVKRVRRDVLEFVIQDHSDHWIEVHIPSDRVLYHPTVQLVLPTLSHRYRCPVQLQHACRWTIRARLNENWQLPAGIQDLPIPNIMKKYINLLSD